jgi:pyruvate/2-oxoglutarate dehydrogenase complex dihydrolipoamide acyltransferase (E2) component
MATANRNRVKVNDVINFVITEFKLDEDDFYKKLGANGLLPKNLSITEQKKVVTDGTKYASHVAADFAANHDITLIGEPKGKRGWTKTELEKMLKKPTTTLPRISKAAKELAEDHKIDWASVTGTSKTGQITIKDIKSIVEKNAESESESESEEE